VRYEKKETKKSVQLYSMLQGYNDEHVHAFLLFQQRSCIIVNDIHSENKVSF
jgi:hypothetical protein